MSQSDGLTQNVPPGRPAWFPWLCASAAALFAFMVITWLMYTNEGLQQLDHDWAFACKEHAESHDGLRQSLADLTRLGGRLFLTILAGMGIVAITVRKHFLLAGIWLVAAGGGSLLNLGVKSVIDRPRPGPELRDPTLRVQHDSYPSGHAMGSTIGYGMCLYAGYFLLRRKAARIALTVGLILLVGLIGFSRIYLRAHWFSDILGGYALGSAWLLFCLGCKQWIARRRAHPAEMSTPRAVRE